MPTGWRQSRIAFVSGRLRADRTIPTTRQMWLWWPSSTSSGGFQPSMAILISAGAGMVLGHLGGTMLDLSARDIPRLAASLQLAAQSASLASQGPALMIAEET